MKLLPCIGKFLVSAFGPLEESWQNCAFLEQLPYSMPIRIDRSFVAMGTVFIEKHTRGRVLDQEAHLCRRKDGSVLVLFPDIEEPVPVQFSFLEYQL